MPNFKVLKEVKIEGTTHAVDAVVELDDDVAAPLVKKGTLEAVVVDPSTSQVDVGTLVKYAVEDNQQNVVIRNARVAGVGTNGNVDLLVDLDDSGHQMKVENVAYNAQPEVRAGEYQLASVEEAGKHIPKTSDPSLVNPNPINPKTGAPSNPDVNEGPVVDPVQAAKGDVDRDDDEDEDEDEDSAA